MLVLFIFCSFFHCRIVSKHDKRKKCFHFTFSLLSCLSITHIRTPWLQTGPALSFWELCHFIQQFHAYGLLKFLLSQGERMWYTLIQVYSLRVSSKGKHYHMCSDTQKSSSVLYKPCNFPGVAMLEQLSVTTSSGKCSIVMHRDHGFWQSGHVKK